jgi:hypothetical protein
MPDEKNPHADFPAEELERLYGADFQKDLNLDASGWSNLCQQYDAAWRGTAPIKAKRLTAAQIDWFQHYMEMSRNDPAAMSRYGMGMVNMPRYVNPPRRGPSSQDQDDPIHALTNSIIASQNEAAHWKAKVDRHRRNRKWLAVVGVVAAIGYWIWFR